jgi:D-sedoheptulose 7-phosphate isomerase
MEKDFKNDITNMFKSSVNEITKSIVLTDKINLAVNQIISAINNGNKIITFGNGGSAADAQHIAAEFIGKFKFKRKSIPSISFTPDSSILTSLSNDFSYDIVFSRQCESLVLNGDVVLGISTSGNSNNVFEGLKTANEKGAFTIGLLGNNGGKINNIVNLSLVVESSETPRIQESHRVIYHIICELVEKSFIESS